MRVSKGLKRTWFIALATIVLLAQASFLSTNQVNAAILQNGVTVTILSPDGEEPVLTTTAVSFEEGDTAFDLLLDVSEKYNIPFHYGEFEGFGAFIISLGNYEPASDWDYWGFFKNGVEAS